MGNEKCRSAKLGHFSRRAYDRTISYIVPIARQLAGYCRAHHGGRPRQDPRATDRGAEPAGRWRNDRRRGRRESGAGRLHDHLGQHTNHSFSQTFYKNLGYNLEQDFSPVGRFASAFYIVVADPKLDVRTLGELIQKARTAPGKLNYASGGIGAATFSSPDSCKRTSKK
jgi:hypothetical protein